MENKTILGLRTCRHDMTAHGGFIWPTSGTVQCSDWNPQPVCGGGLHFLPWGEGDGTLLDWAEDAKWLVVKVNVDSMVTIDHQKAKAPACEVVFCGDQYDTTQYITNNGGHNRFTVGITLTAGDKSTLNAGYGSRLTAEDKSTLTAGDRSTLTAGNYSTLTAGTDSTLTAGNHCTLAAGEDSTLTAGHGSTLTAGHGSTLTCSGYGTLTAGDESTLTGGDGGRLTGGDGSTLTAGNGSTLTAGDHSTLEAGDNSTLKAGYGSTLTIKYYDECTSIGYVGRDLLANVPYTNKNGKFVVCK